MTKEELLESFTNDFIKTRGAINEILSHNRTIDNLLVEDLCEREFGKLEEHIEISKIIMDGVKGFNELYKNAPIILENINKLKDEDDTSKKDKPSLKDIMDNLD